MDEPAPLNLEHLRGLQELLKVFTYKPGWRARIIINPVLNHPSLQMQVQVPDSNPPHFPTTITHHHPIPHYDLSPEEWMRWLFDRIVDVERHEAMEFYRVEGKRPYDPHAEPGRPYAVVRS